MHDNNLTNHSYNARHAWLRAGAYFAIGCAAGWYFGIVRKIVAEPFVTVPQLGSATWWGLSIFVSVYVLFAYGWYWPRGTVTHGRPRRLFAGFIFGGLWGFCQGLLMLAVYALIVSFDYSTVFNVVLMFLVWSTWTALWHSRYWDIKIAPEHNIAEWNLRKVLVAHAPFLLLCVTHYALFSNAALYVLWQVIALTASTLAMRFPAPHDD